MKKVISLFQWLIFVFIIPLIVFTIVGATTLHFSGVDVIGKANQIANYINRSEKIEKLQIVLDDTKEVLEEKISSEKNLLKTIADKNQEIEIYKKEIESLKEQLQSSIQHQQIQDDITKSYQNMSPEKAAAILSESEEEQAIDILRGIKPDILAQILENMEPSTAANLTKGITE